MAQEDDKIGLRTKFFDHFLRCFKRVPKDQSLFPRVRGTDEGIGESKLKIPDPQPIHPLGT